MQHVIGAGLVPPAAALFLLGRGGAILMVIMLFMAVTSSGSAELVAVSSLFTYDVYRTYIKPNATGTLSMCLLAHLRLAETLEPHAADSWAAEV